MPTKKKITKYSFSSHESQPSKKSPTGYPTKLRHLVAYHNPGAMGYEFWECTGFSVLTNHRYNDLRGDIVWVVGRPSGRTSFYLDCRFRVDKAEALDDSEHFAYRVSGEEGFVFFPHSRLNTKPWFQQLLKINPNLSLGLQVVHDAVVLAGLRKEYESAKAWQNGS